MTGGLDELSRVIGSIEAGMQALAARADEDRRLRDQAQTQTLKAIDDLGAFVAKRVQTFEDYKRSTDKRISSLEMLQPIVAGLQLTRSKITTLASIGLGIVVLVGWVAEAVVRWAVALVLSHWH